MTGNWVVAGVTVAVLVYVGMGIRASLLLRRTGVPAPKAWLAGILGWPLVRRIVSRRDADGS